MGNLCCKRDGKTEEVEVLVYEVVKVEFDKGKTPTAAVGEKESVETGAKTTASELERAKVEALLEEIVKEKPPVNREQLMGTEKIGHDGNRCRAVVPFVAEECGDVMCSSVIPADWSHIVFGKDRILYNLPAICYLREECEGLPVPLAGMKELHKLLGQGPDVEIVKNELRRQTNNETPYQLDDDARRAPLDDVGTKKRKGTPEIIVPISEIISALAIGKGDTLTAVNLSESDKTGPAVHENQGMGKNDHAYISKHCYRQPVEQMRSGSSCDKITSSCPPWKTRSTFTQHQPGHVSANDKSYGRQVWYNQNKTLDATLSKVDTALVWSETGGETNASFPDKSSGSAERVAVGQRSDKERGGQRSLDPAQ